MRIGGTDVLLPRIDLRDFGPAGQAIVMLVFAVERALRRVMDAVNENEASALVYDTASDRPAASESLRGRMSLVIGGGGAGVDRLAVCMEVAPGNFQWVTVV
jgi:hypothetical protein